MTPLSLVALLFILLSILSIIIIVSIEYDKDVNKNKEKRDKALQITGIIIGLIAVIGVLIIICVKLYALSLVEEIKHIERTYPVFGQTPSSNNSSERAEVEQKFSEMRRKSYRPSPVSPPTSSERAEMERKLYRSYRL